LPVYLPYYIADSLLNLPKTKDWLLDVAVAESRKQKEHEAAAGLGTELPPQIKKTLPSRDLKDFVGVYENPVFQNFIIRLEAGEGHREDMDHGENSTQGFDGKLYYQYATWEGDLEHYHYDSFRFMVDAFGAHGRFLLTFTTSEDGQVSSLVCPGFGDNVRWTKKETEA
ncbi:hypothetical protein BGZ94_006462, partial [Podila epigama]